MTLEDWSQVKQIADRLQRSGVDNIAEHLGGHPEDLRELMSAPKVLDANPAAIRVYRATAKTDFGDTHQSSGDAHRRYPVTTGTFVTLLKRLSGGETRVELEGPELALDGATIHVRTTTTIGQGHERDWLRVLRTVEDLTEQKRAQDSLAESEALLTQSAEMANIGHAVWDPVCESYTAVSENWAAIFGYSKKGFTASITNLAKDRLLIHPEDCQREHDHYVNLKPGHEAPEIEYRIIRPDGEIRHVLQLSRHVFDASGQPTQAFISVQDITDRKLVDEELRKSHALYRHAEEMGGLGHWTWDHVNARMESCSEQLARIHEMTVAEALEFFNNVESANSIVHPDDQARHVQHLSDALAYGKTGDIEYRIITRSGLVRHVHQRSEVLLDEQGGDIRFFGTVQDITERKQLSEELAYQASHDSLTGLINRKEFERRLNRVLETARKRNDEHALCYLDLDQFKVINDTCGHMAGDELLRQLAQLLSKSVRKRDSLARLGGDEFGLLMEQCTLAQAQRVAAKLVEEVADFRFNWEGRVFRIGVSIGLVPITESSANVGKVLSAADSACYAAKDEGRSRVHVYRLDDGDLVRRQGEMRWVARIDQALEEQRFQLWSQPIVPVTPGSHSGENLELLLRMIDEQGETVMPTEFQQAAEHYGFSAKLDRWVVGTALQWLGGNPRKLDQLHLCFIKLSATSLTDTEFLEFVHKQFENSHVPSAKICFQVTETAVISNLSRAMTFIAQLKQRGCRFALDNFGSGLSSFAYLKSLPVDYVKIDGTFIKNLVDDKVSQAFVRSINDVANVMGKSTIAESVKNEAVLEKLREIGVDYAQGPGIGLPSPIE